MTESAVDIDESGAVDPPSVPNRRTRGLQAGQLLPICTIVVAFIVSRTLYWWAGVRFDMTTLDSATEQVLALRLLKGPLLTSVWHLNSQPPLFNLFAGLLVHLPRSFQMPVAWFTFMALGLTMVLSAYLLLIDLRFPQALALVASLVLVVSPTQVVYENWFFYAYPSAVAVTLACLFLVRYVRTRRWPYGVAFFSAVSGLALLNSEFQAVWVIAVVVLVAVSVRVRLRDLFVVALVPLLAFIGWVAKDYAMFGTVTTSSWIGMNLADDTIKPASRTGQLQEMVDKGELDHLALVGPFKPVSAYVPRYVRPRITGVAALDDPLGNRDAPNFNNSAYVTVSSDMLADDLRYIELAPLDYLHNVSIGATVAFTPVDQYPFVYDNWLKVQPLATGFDRILGWQITPSPAASTEFAALDGHRPPLATISYSAVLITALGVFGAPAVVLLRRRRPDRPTVATMGFIWITVVYSVASSSLLDLGENNRVRFELGPAPVILAMIVALQGWQAVARRLPAGRGRQP